MQKYTMRRFMQCVCALLSVAAVSIVVLVVSLHKQRQHKQPVAFLSVLAKRDTSSYNPITNPFGCPAVSRTTAAVLTEAVAALVRWSSSSATGTTQYEGAQGRCPTLDLSHRSEPSATRCADTGRQHLDFERELACRDIMAALHTNQAWCGVSPMNAVNTYQGTACLRHHPIFSLFLPPAVWSHREGSFGDFLGLSHNVEYERGRYWYWKQSERLWIEEHDHRVAARLKHGTPVATRLPLIDAEAYPTWVSMLLAVARGARCVKQSFVVADLGAGHAVWSLRAYGAMRRIRELHPDCGSGGVTTKLLVVDGDERDILEATDTLRRNGVDMRHAELVGLPVSVDGGLVNFDDLKISENAGAPAGRPSLTMGQLLKDFDHVDWMHMCVQGHLQH